MSNYVERVIEETKKRNPGEAEFHQTVEEVLTSLKPVIEKHPEYEEASLLERLVEPERGISFRVVWADDNGKVHVNKGYRYEFNSAIGPYKGGLRFAPSVYPGIIKFLGFEQIFKNSLTGLPIGGGKGGSDFDPNGKSDAEVMRFCQAFMTELYRHIGPSTDVPAGDLGVGGREIGYMYGQYKRIVNRFEGVLTGKGIPYGGALGRAEATGFGIVWYCQEMLKANGEDIKGKKIAISGFGNVAWGTAMKITQLGGKCVTISGPDGYIIDEDGVGTEEKWQCMLDLRASGKNVVAPYAERFPNAKFVAGKKPWEYADADVYIPCATQNEIQLEDAKKIVASGTKFVCEGANMPTTNEALAYLQDNGLIVGPAKAANAGGVACSCIEMGQNAGKTVFSAEEVLDQLHTIMVNIHKACADASQEYYGKYDLVKGANIAGFLKVAEAMMAQGLV